RHVQETGAGPDAVIGGRLVELVEQHRFDWMVEPACGDRSHFRRAVGDAHAKTFGEHHRRMVAGAAAEFEDRTALRQQREKARKPRRGRLGPASIGFGVLSVEPQRIVVHVGLPHGNNAICSSPVVSGPPNIRFMFWMACPAEPFTRLSSVAITMARPLMRSATTPICT